MTRIRRIAILGAGCSGLSVAWGLCEQGNAEVTVLDSAPSAGGLARTIEQHGLRFDIGPHRLSPQLPGIVEKIRALPGVDLMELENEHGVYFNGTIYSYPPRLRDLCTVSSLKYTALFAAGWLSARFWSAVRALTGPGSGSGTFEDIIRHSFGGPFSDRVALPMIKKVWGTHDLHEDFARIRFELPTIRAMLRRLFRERSLLGVRTFYYPRRGFGRIPEAISRLIQSRGHTLELTAAIRTISADTLNGPFRISYGKDGREHEVSADVIVSTISNRMLIGYLPASLAGPLLPLAPAFPSRTMRLGIIVVKGFRLPARVIIFPEAHILFNRLSSVDQFSPELCPEGHAVLMCDVVCDQGGSYDTMPDEQFNAILIESILELGWFERSTVVQVFSLRFSGAYPVLDHERYQAQEQVETFFDGSGIILCGREASSDYNNAHNAIGKGFLVADYISGRIDARTMKQETRTVGRLPIQD